MKKTFLLCLGVFFGTSAQADIYKCVDESGHVAFADGQTKSAYKDCKLIMRDGSGSPATRVPESRTSRKATPTPEGFPRVDQQTQKLRDDKRRQILEEELATERKALEEARKNYAEGEANPEIYKGKDGKTYRNVSGFEEKMQKLREDVALHEQNVKLLEKELGAIR